ncbi:MAG TPA: efflux RND transporter periplasmic adaptor subunit [Polyangiaceae bacterium]|jgi:RND family efflux transporter MFP subunit
MTKAPFIFAMLVIACHGAASPPEKDQPVEARCVAAATRSIDETLLVRGRVEPPPGGDLPVASQVAGRVERIDVREGQHVAAGDVVGRVESAPSRDVAQQADAAVAQARAGAANANSTLARTQILVTKGIAAKQELDDARARADAAKASLNAALASADQAHRMLGRVEVRSTFPGIITRVFRGPGALVDGTAATPLVQLAAEGGVELVADVTEVDLLRIAPGQTATITFPFGAKATTGVVRTRAAALEASTGLGVVRIGIEPTDAPLGSFGHALLAIGHRDGVLVVPAAALRNALADGAELVRCTADDKAEVASVDVGWRDDQFVEITKGLAAGDRVATEHVLGLQDGTPIAKAKP